MAKSATPSAANGNNKDVSIDDLSDQISVLKNDIASLTSTLSSYGREKSHELTKTAKETVSDLSEAGRARALEAQSQAEEFVRTQPGTALGLAAGIGFLVGVVMSRR